MDLSLDGEELSSSYTEEFSSSYHHHHFIIIIGEKEHLREGSEEEKSNRIFVGCQELVGPINRNKELVTGPSFWHPRQMGKDQEHYGWKTT